jgi:ABC-type protease/lipase transport system fused ATPase/permease subunit
MDPKVSALERAFQLARSGRVANVDDIKKRLKLEGYDQQVVDGGPSLTSQLRNRIKAARLLRTP